MAMKNPESLKNLVDSSPKSRKLNPREKKRAVWAYVFLAPQIIVFFGLSLYPIIMSYVYSFFDWTGVGPLDNFIGLGNYIELLNHARFWNSFVVTVYYILGTTVLAVGVGLVLAIILNDARLGGKGFYRALYFLPVVTTTAIVGIIMRNIFGTEGMFNDVLRTLNIIDSSIPWLTNGTLALTVLIVVGAWKGLGINMVYWLAALQSIPNDVYESAQLDGAGFWKTLWYITLPLLRPMLAVIVLLSLVSGINAFDLVMTLTNGGPYYATETLDLFIYNFAFSAETGGSTRMGFASAAGVLLGIFTFFLSIIYGIFSFRKEIKSFIAKKKSAKAVK